MRITPNITPYFIQFLFVKSAFRGNFGFSIADLLYRFALSFFIKLKEYLKSKFENPKPKIYPVRLLSLQHSYLPQ